MQVFLLCTASKAFVVPQPNQVVSLSEPPKCDQKDKQNNNPSLLDTRPGHNPAGHKAVLTAQDL